MLPGDALPGLRYQLQVVNRVAVALDLLAHLPGESRLRLAEVRRQVGARGREAKDRHQTKETRQPRTHPHGSFSGGKGRDGDFRRCREPSGPAGPARLLAPTQTTILLQSRSKSRI